MQPRTKPIPYGVKLRKLYAKQFYLAKEWFNELILSLEEGTIRKDREAVSFIDQHGEWIDG